MEQVEEKKEVQQAEEKWIEQAGERNRKVQAEEN